MRRISLQSRVKIAVLITFGALFVPIAAQAGTATTVSSAGTVTINNFSSVTCPTDTGTVTSVQAQSVLLILDTVTVPTTADSTDYHFYTETNTALWGASYTYGQAQLANCGYADMTGSMTLTRGPFVASSGAAYSETSTIGANAQFIQYVGNLNLSGTAWTATNACGNTTVPNLNVANACDFTDVNKQAEWPRVNTGQAQLVRTGISSGVSLPKTGVQTTPQQAATVFVIVKAKKTTIAAAPMNTSWVSTETFTVTST
jgi:hypothetical protein